MKVELLNSGFVNPYILKPTQFTECPSNNHVRPYTLTKDPGIKIGIDENSNCWIIDGHHRVGSAIHSGTFVKVGEITEVSEQEMLSLLYA